MSTRKLTFRQLFFSCFSILALLSGLVQVSPVLAADTPNPSSVTIAGSLQSELGCGGDWDPACAATHLTYEAADDVWQGTWNVPAGSWEYKAALNDSWDENYGLNATRNGANLALNLASDTTVKFYYDHKSHWVTSNHNSVIATVPGNFQSALGCPGDWQPDCLRSWLQDPDGDGTYAFATDQIPSGNYEAKVAINESWDENYGAGGAQNGANIGFNVPADNLQVTFTYDPTTHVLDIDVAAPPAFAHDNDVAWDGLRHDSRDTLYRTPGGAVPAGTEVLLRFRTFHNDVTGVSLRLYDLNASAQHILPMSLAAEDVSCYQPGLDTFTCDFWQVALDGLDPNNYWYRFIVSDGTDTDYYADNTSALDGGLGATTEDAVDQSYALMFYDPSFSAPGWAASASIYQIFPDRFRDGRANNNPRSGDPRYDDPVLALPWGTLPEGYCRNYADGNTNCPWRFDATPPESSPNKEQPRGRDYFGGDLKGVDQNLEYLQFLGVNTIYFNPVFDAGSNHLYDTQDYYKIDPYFGTQKDWENLVKHADQLGIRIVLDGVFNHLSSDSPIFDRYGHYPAVGACESAASPYRAWFRFREPGPGEPSPCAPSTPGGTDTYYDGWFGFDSIPVINKSLPEVQEYFLTGQDSVSRHWLNQGASGWRLDVSGDASFPNGYWETFREVTKGTDPESLLISETWQKDSTLLRMLRGDRLDTTMNYRLRDAVIGFLAPGPFDSKGFADSGRIISPAEFAARLESIREDYPDAAYYSLMNLLDSHDTERLRWTLTPGQETLASKEGNSANVEEGKLRQRLASLIQFTVPGAPTVYYGDEVGMTGDDDPDDRRTYPWLDRGGTPDQQLFSHYQSLNNLRSSNDVLVSGDFKILLADDSAGVVAYGRKTDQQAAIIIVNRSDTARSVSIPVAGYLRDGLALEQNYLVGAGGPGAVSVTDGSVDGSIGAKSAVVLVSGAVDLQPPAAPAGLSVAEGDAEVSLSWNPVGGASSYNVYRSPLSGGGWVKANGGPLSGTTFTDSEVENARLYYYVVTAVDAAGNESGYSDEVSALPHYTIDWANLQWPPSMVHTISATDRTDNVYGQVWIEGVTNLPGPTAGLRAQLGFGPDGSHPDGNADWTWEEAAFNVDAGNNDEFVASMLPEAVGQYDYAYRYSTTNGREWIYADQGEGTNDGYSPGNAGALTVSASDDTTAPAAPGGLHVVSASPAGVELAWDAVQADASLYGYEVLRSDTSGGPYDLIARLTQASYTDTSVAEAATYYYVVRSLDTSFNRSGFSSQVQATAELRTVTVVFNVTVPAATDGTGRSVYIAGSLDRLDGGLPQWDPGGVALERVDATTWTITVSGKEGTQIAYKYTLGDWEHVEKDAGCGEISDRQLTLGYGATGTQSVNDTVPNWRNVAPCGN